MKTYRFLFHGCCLAAALLTAIPLTGQTIKDSRVFKARRQTNITQSLSMAQMTVSDTIPLQDLGAVYAFSIDAIITQPRESSFVRIVLEDTEGHDYLVAESDRFRNDASLVQLCEYCEETAKLPGVIPSRLKCYIASDATLQLTAYHSSDREPTRRELNSEETVAAIKEAQVQSIVDRINEYNARHGKLWRAGLNNWALSEYNNDIKGEGDAYTANFKYYTEGLYEMGERPAQRSAYTSPYVDSFDWRDRHGKNWITSIKDQGNTSNCTFFSTIGMTEAVTNLYFNDTINLDLSEQCLMNYITPPTNAYDRLMQCGYILSQGVIDESDSLQYTGLVGNSGTPRPYGNECISYSSYHRLYKPYFTIDQFTDTLKWNLIHRGPGSWGYSYPEVEYVYGSAVRQHYMTLVGYGTVHAGDTCTLLKPNYMNTIIMPDSLDGYDYWIFKDSYGSATNSTYQHNGFRYVVFYETSYMDNEAYFILTPIYRRGHTDDEIVVEDRDGDGYFNWGIGPRPDDMLPSWAEQEEDGNDNNKNKGSMSTYGTLSDISYPTTTITINQSMTDSLFIANEGLSRFLRCNIRLAAGVTFTINGNLAFYAGKKIYMNQNSTLTIDGGTLVDPTLYKSGTGCTVKIMNGGKIQRHKKSEFALPYGISLEMDDGSIFE